MRFAIANPFTEDLAVDLGTVHTFIYGRGRGMVVNEPSLVANDRVTGEVIAVGNEALEMLGRSPEDVEVAYPMQDGVVADSELAQKMLQKFVRKARGGRARFSRRIIHSVPSGISSVERFAIREVVRGIGASRVYLVEEGLAAAIGAKLPVAEMKASMVVDVGGATTSIAVTANAGIVESETLRIGRHAAAHQIAVAPHVVHELSLQVVGALSNGFLVEFIDWTPPDLFEEMPECTDGCFRVPGRPGHGMALARGAKEKYRSA